MEEYEVDLRDYLRVIWQKKWIILGVLLVAVLAAGLISYRSPTRYKTAGIYQWHRLPAISGAQLAAPSVQAVVALLDSPSLLEQASHEVVHSGGPGAAGLRLKVKAEEGLITVEPKVHTSTPERCIPAEEGLITVELQGALDPERLRAVLERLTALGMERLDAQVRAELEGEEARLAQQLQLLRSKEEDLSQEIRQLLANASDRQLPVGEFNATLEGFTLRRQLEGLYSRLANVRRQLDNLELTRSEVALLAKDPPEVLVVLSPPYTGVPVGPNREMNLAVAGVLGLFVGVLLAFFVHYLEGGGRPEAGAEAEKEEASAGASANADAEGA